MMNTSLIINSKSKLKRLRSAIPLKCAFEGKRKGLFLNHSETFVLMKLQG